MRSLRAKLLFLLMLELHPTTFNNKLSHDNIIEKYSSEHIQKKDEKKCKLQKKPMNLFANAASVLQGFQKIRSNPLFLL